MTFGMNSAGSLPYARPSWKAVSTTVTRDWRNLYVARPGSTRSPITLATNSDSRFPAP